MIFKLLKYGVGFVLNIAGAMMAFVVLQKIAKRISWKTNKGFSFLSKNTMPMYLFHQQVIYCTVFWLNGILHPYLHVAVNLICATAISLLLSAVLMRFRWTRFLIGEK